MLSYYTYKEKFAESWMSDDNHEHLISPRSCALKNGCPVIKHSINNNNIMECIICSSCNDTIHKNNIPIRGISNFLLQGLQEELNDITDIEWSYVSLLRTHAHFLQFHGGKNKKVKGYHSF